MTDLGFESLAHAIIVQAVNDYSIAVNTNPQNTAQIASLERFFKSEWCSELSGMTGEAMMKVAKKKAALDRGEKVDVYF